MTTTRKPETNAPEPEVINLPAAPLLPQGADELFAQIECAKRYPRDVVKFQEEAKALATLDEETAGACFYSLPRREKQKDGTWKTKPIEGPGVRLAEIVGHAWGNLRYAARIIREERDIVVAQGIAHDLQRNVASSTEVRRRITTKEGTRYNADMITVTANAACSIALRNAIFKVVPKLFVVPIEKAARLKAVGTKETLPQRREKMLLYWQGKAIGTERVLKALGRKKKEEITLEDLETAIGWATAVNEGAAVESIFNGSGSDIEKPRRKSESQQVDPEPQNDTPTDPEPEAKEPTIEERREAMLVYWQRHAVSHSEVFRALGVNGINDVTEQHLEQSKTWAAMVEAGAPIDGIFRPPEFAAKKTAKGGGNGKLDL